MVWPTMSGMIVERRDQVLMTFFSPAALRTSTFLRRWSSMNGPFLSERGIWGSWPYRRAPRVRRRRAATTRGLALASTVRVGDGVHGHATGLGADALPAVAAGRADLDQLGLG